MSQGSLHTSFLNHLVPTLQKALPLCRVFRMTSGAVTEPHFRRFGIPGHPDLFILIPGGRIIYVEAKTGTGRLSKAQLAWERMCERMRIPHLIAHCPADASPREVAVAFSAKTANLLAATGADGAQNANA